MLDCLFRLRASSTEKTTSRLVSEVGGAWIDHEVTVGLSKSMMSMWSDLSGFVCLSSCCAFPFPFPFAFPFPSLPCCKKTRKKSLQYGSVAQKQRYPKISEDSTALSLSKERTLSGPVSLLSCQRQLPLTRNSAPVWQVRLPQHCRCGYDDTREIYICCVLFIEGWG